MGHWCSPPGTGIGAATGEKGWGWVLVLVVALSALNCLARSYAVTPHIGLGCVNAALRTLQVEALRKFY